MEKELKLGPYTFLSAEERVELAMAEQLKAIEQFQQGFSIDDASVTEKAVNDIERASIIARAAQIEAVAIYN